MTDLTDLGVLGLATMGANLARNAARKGFGVALFNRHGARTDELVAAHNSGTLERLFTQMTGGDELERRAEDFAKTFRQ